MSQRIFIAFVGECPFRRQCFISPDPQLPEPHQREEDNHNQNRDDEENGSNRFFHTPTLILPVFFVQSNYHVVLCGDIR